MSFPVSFFQSFVAIVHFTTVLLGFLSPLQPQSINAADVSYQHGPDSKLNAANPRGTVTEHTLSGSRIFPGTKRRYSLYVPAQYRPERPAALMVFQDGHAFVGARGDFRVPIVFDNLIARGAMPVTIAVMIDPGHKGELPDKRGWKPTPANRSVEYDTVNGDYAKFLLEEVLPPIEANYRITQNPELRAICGNSSGGICAFSVAWHRPDQFRKVLSHIGSFVDLRGGHNYPPMIRKTDKKPLRVLLQMVKTIWTTALETGPWRIAKWHGHCHIRITITNWCLARESTMENMPAPSFPNPYSGCGEVGKKRAREQVVEQIRATVVFTRVHSHFARENGGDEKTWPTQRNLINND